MCRACVTANTSRGLDIFEELQIARGWREEAAKSAFRAGGGKCCGVVASGGDLEAPPLESGTPAQTKAPVISGVISVAVKSSPGLAGSALRVPQVESLLDVSGLDPSWLFSGSSGAYPGSQLSFVMCVSV
eukprot:CAMPEP_0204262488 /NCGR_PEP_ID=MMETSP0468-20130131/7717_1 /ASSEMBLY_ACC=CAM_ASM_000383 /TAXON_ID=2969 /ORGANISM="Oxyrrhis marina" /LENGTH=129 /DNA_ID=CAMNT_0051237157 /DNA_START=1 /DNA_END=389 /DNA_ORIENTATION=+